jgi:hypothetical protein
MKEQEKQAFSLVVVVVLWLILLLEVVRSLAQLMKPGSN